MILFVRKLVFLYLLGSICSSYAQPYAYITNQGDNSVSVINTETNNVIKYESKLKKKSKYDEYRILIKDKRLIGKQNKPK